MAITIFCIVCFEAVVRGIDDVSNNRTKGAERKEEMYQKV